MSTEETWVCFHCGFSTSDAYEAAAHFGDRDEEEPLCKTWNDLNADGRAAEYQSALMALKAEREDNAYLRGRVDGLEYRVENQIGEIHSFAPFRGCDTVGQIFHVYDSMEGRALSAEATVREMRGNHLDIIAWLRHWLTQLVHVRVEDEKGNYANGYAAARIPDWSIRQKLEELEKTIGFGECPGHKTGHNGETADSDNRKENKGNSVTL